MNLTATVLIQVATFAVLVWCLKRLLWEPLMSLMQARSVRQADGRAAAERGLHELVLAERRADAVREQAQREAQRLLADAERQAVALRADAKAAAAAEAARRVQAAKAEIGRELTQARRELGTLGTQLAGVGARRLLNAGAPPAGPRDRH